MIDIEKAIELLKNILPKKVSYANLVGASNCYGDKYVYEDPEPYAIELAISALTQQLNNGWIPVPERLPNHEEYCKNDGRFIVTDGNRVYQALFDIYDSKAFCNSGVKVWKLYVDNRPIAWQPLPEAYKEDEKMNIQNIIDNENLQDSRSKLQTIARYYGIEPQTRQAIEEMAELTQALCKQIKNKCPQPSLNTIEELADVKIMLDQMVYLFGCGDQIENVMKIKLNRQMERIKRGQ